MDPAVRSELFGKLLEAVRAGSIPWDSLLGITATCTADPRRGVCEVVRVAVSQAQHLYLIVRAEDGTEYRELAKARAFCSRHRDIKLPQALAARLQQEQEVRVGSASGAATRGQPPSAPAALAHFDEAATLTVSTQPRSRPPADVAATEDEVALSVRTNLPRKRSEADFACDLMKLRFPPDRAPQVWFPRLPGERDVDVVIWAPRIGLICLELKSWSLDCIRRLSIDRFELKPRCHHSTRLSPWDQVHDAGHEFRSNLEDDSSTWEALKKPWVTGGVGLYKISRASFVGKFMPLAETAREEKFVRRLAENTLFSEDLESGGALLVALDRIWWNPVLGKSPKYAQWDVSTETAVQVLDRFISVSVDAATAKTAYDHERLKRLEEASTDVLGTVDWASPVTCEGRVGTGKTFLGLRAAISYLEEAGTTSPEGAVFLTFNKVLATDIRRLLDLHPRYSKYRLDVFDVYSLLKWVGRRCDEEPHWGNGDPDVLAREWIASHETSAYLRGLKGHWAMIVVDEAQDLQDWMWQLVDSLRSEDGRLLVIDGTGELLYRHERAPYLKALLERARRRGSRSMISMETVFRTWDITFCVCQVFSEKFPSAEEAASYWAEVIRPEYERVTGRPKDLPLKLISKLGVRLGRPGGRLPSLVQIARSSIDATAELLAPELRRALVTLREEMGVDIFPSDILILVPLESHKYRARSLFDWSYTARRMCQMAELDFIDYSAKDERRHGFSPDQVRICTYHSSRGIEGLHSFVLGFEQIGAAARESDEEWLINGVGHIALSRSLYDTTIVCRQTGEQSTPVSFLAGVLDMLDDALPG